MYHVEIYVRVRRACMVEGMSVREASRVFGLHRDTVRKMLAYSAPPGYRRQDPPRRPRLEPFTGVIDAILEADRQVPRKQRHTAKRIFERLRDEHGFDGQCTIVKDYVRERRRRTQEMFVPLSHAPGHAQCDFGEARVIIEGVVQALEDHGGPGTRRKVSHMDEMPFFRFIYLSEDEKEANELPEKAITWVRDLSAYRRTITRGDEIRMDLDVWKKTRTDEPRTYESELANNYFCTPDQCVERIAELQSQHGISYFGANFAFGSMAHAKVMASMKLFAEEVMLKFK